VVTHEEGVGLLGRDGLREALLYSEGLVARGKRGHGGHALDYLHDDVVLVRIHASIAFVLRRESVGHMAADSHGTSLGQQENAPEYHP
jgi:hypothetical protein